MKLTPDQLLQLRDYPVPLPWRERVPASALVTESNNLKKAA